MRKKYIISILSIVVSVIVFLAFPKTIEYNLEKEQDDILVHLQVKKINQWFANYYEANAEVINQSKYDVNYYEHFDEMNLIIRSGELIELSRQNGKLKEDKNKITLAMIPDYYIKTNSKITQKKIFKIKKLKHEKPKIMYLFNYGINKGKSPNEQNEIKIELP